MDRPLRLAVDLSEERRNEFFDACLEADEEPLGNVVESLAPRLGDGPHLDFNDFLETVKAEVPRHGIKLTARRKRLLRDGLADRYEEAEPVVKKVHRQGTATDPIRGLYEVGEGSEHRVVEFEHDSELRDTEQIPLREEGGIEGFLRREVLPYAPDAWYAPQSVKTGYEISFNRYFYKPEPMRTLEEIRADIAAVEREAEGAARCGGVGKMMSGRQAGRPIESAARLRVYLDATMILGSQDPQRAGPLHGLIRQAVRGDVALVVSDLTVDELRDAPADVYEVMDASILPRAERVPLTPEALELAGRYVESGVVTRARRADARHVAAATVAGADALVSWNRRILNWERVRRYNEINRLTGYGPIDACDPRALEHGLSDPEPATKSPVVEPGERGFRVMPWLRAIRARIYEETKDMTPEERLRWRKKRPANPHVAGLVDRVTAPEAGKRLPGDEAGRSNREAEPAEHDGAATLSGLQALRRRVVGGSAGALGGTAAEELRRDSERGNAFFRNR